MAKTRKSVMLKSLKIGKLELKNRFVVSPMVTVFCDQDGMATEQFITYHETKAKGGWGLIIVEDYAVDPRGRGFWTPGLWKDEQIKSHKQLVDRVHKAGAKIFAQIYHSGRQTASALIGTTPWSASPIPCPVGCEVPHEMTIEEIEQTVSQFGDTALRAKKAGFDGVEVHGAHGYLISQFMSKYSNRRVDRYGGALENRLRFPIEILKDIRKKVGKDFIVDFRISADEYVDGGRTIEESKAAMKRLAAEGVDLFHVSAGVYGSAWAIIPPYNIPNGWIVNLAEEAKKVVDVPVITVGRINDPLIAETIVESGKADLVAMGRASLADPALPNKFAAGDYKDIRQCIGCQQGCLQLLFSNKSIRCLVNPELGFEYLHDLKKADASRRVTVVGGGPGGLEAARAAALAGHKVTLYDNTNRLGGQFVYAAMPPAKGDMTAYVVWAKRQLKKLGVEVKLNTEYTAAMRYHSAAWV